MASGGDSVKSGCDGTLDYQNVCSICLENFRDPYNLPCEHFFCGICLIGYLKKCLIQEGEDKNTFPCPLCRTKILVSNYTMVELDDVQKLRQLSFSRMDVENESRSYSCEPCKRGDNNVQATHFCNDCAELLCAECLTHHNRNKMTLKHTVRDLSKGIDATINVKTLVKTTCPKHNMKKYKYICIDHDSLCCSKCVIYDHRKCRYVNSFSEFVQGKQFTGLLKKINDSFANIHGLTRTVRFRDSELSVEEGKFEETLKDFEKDIHDEIRNLFQKQRTSVLQKIEHEKQKMKQTVEESLSQENRISQISKLFHLIKDCEDAQLKVIVCKEVLTRLETEKTPIDKVTAALQNINLNNEIEIQHIIHHMNGAIESVFLRLISDKYRFMGHTKSGRVKLVKSTSSPRKVNDILLLECGNIVLATSDVGLSVLDSVSLTEINKISLSSQATSLAEYTKNSLAIALPEEKKMAILRVFGQKIGVSYVETDLPFHCIAAGIVNQIPVLVTITPETGEIYYQNVMSCITKNWTPVKAYFRSVIKMCVDGYGQMIFISQYKVNKICGIDFQGHVKFAFAHHQLHMPFGMFLCASDKLYVCCYGTQQVCEVTPSTRNFADKICGLEGLKGPMSIAFNTTRTKCVVYDDEKGKELKVFDMTH